MNRKGYYHMFSNGDDAKNFIITIDDRTAAFNRIGVCAANCNVEVCAFSIEDTHIHVLLYGTYENCTKFKELYGASTLHYIRSRRGNAEGVEFNCEIESIEDIDHLMAVGTYVIVQPTKDGKNVMPYDYLWGTGSLYFRSWNTIPIWQINEDGTVSQPLSIGNLTVRERKRILCSKMEIPAEWKVCNGFILPTNYVSIERYQSIYKTFNAFRAFLGGGRKRFEQVLDNMAKSHGVILEDVEARAICQECSMKLYKTADARRLSTNERLTLAREIRRLYSVSFRQLASLTYLPESEIRKYIQ